MSYLTADRLGDELARLYTETSAEGEVVNVIEVRNSVRFRAQIGSRFVDFSVPEDELSNAPLTFVSDNYLKPLLAKARADV